MSITGPKPKDSHNRQGVLTSMVLPTLVLCCTPMSLTLYIVRNTSRLIDLLLNGTADMKESALADEHGTFDEVFAQDSPVNGDEDDDEEHAEDDNAKLFIRTVMTLRSTGITVKDEVQS
uniref:Uncharacterized protein n=1 Tax=Lygus hesperus TaxID=30085 RepID=A0A146KQT4_LYGHE